MGVNGGGWKRLLVTGKAPSGAACANLYLRLSGGSYVGTGGGSIRGRVVWDDVTLAKSAPSAQDPSFEKAGQLRMRSPTGRSAPALAAHSPTLPAPTGTAPAAPPPR